MNVNILLIEDSAEDLKIVDFHLRKLPFPYHRIWATNKAEFIASLGSSPDIIVSDFSLPDTDGFEILELVKKDKPEIPVIIVSGTIGEVKAVNLMVNGAKDYILKDRLKRLVPAIERELKEAELRKEKSRTENALYAAREKAEESDRLKTAFLANISHEIRTPLNGIMGFSGLLSPNLLPEVQKEYIEIIIQSGDQLLKIMNDVLDMSRIETQDLILEKSRFDLGQFISDIYIEYSTRYRLKKPKIRFVNSTEGDLADIKIVTDKDKLKQILSNILENAFKFTSRGEITMACNLKENEIGFCVKDTGIGIPQDAHEIIFEHFRQADSGISQLYGGTGLGLAICKTLVELMGGKIYVKSQPRHGSEFTFTIPVESLTFTEKKESVSEDVENCDFKGAKILIAEDDEINFFLLEEYLSGANCQLFHASDGSEVGKLLSLNKGIELILMDIKMPYVNGIEALKQLREKKINTPVIAQTAYRFDYNKDQLLSMGFNDFISKPIDRKDLLKIMCKFLEKPEMIRT